MNDIQKMSEITEAEINEIAKKYWDAKKINDKNEMDNYKIRLYLICIGTNVLNRKMRAVLATWKIYDDEANDEIIDYFDDMFKYFNYEKNDSFVAYMLRYLPKYKAKKKKNEFNYESFFYESEEEIIEKVSIGSETPFENEEILHNVRTRIPLLVLNFYKHNGPKTATPARYNYFKVFNTENIIQLIDESGHTRYFNKAEAYESTDKEFVRFIADTSYEQFDDILSMKYRNFSDVLENYEYEDKEIDVPCDARIISEYFYKSGKSEQRTSASNISQFRTKYEEYFRTVWEQ